MPITQVVLGVLLSFGVCAAVICLRAFLLAPVMPRRGTDVCWLIRATGEAEGLEETIRSIALLRDTGRTCAKVIIAAEGLSDEAYKRAEILSRRVGGRVCDAGQIQEFLEGNLWTEADTR